MASLLQASGPPPVHIRVRHRNHHPTGSDIMRYAGRVFRTPLLALCSLLVLGAATASANPAPIPAGSKLVFNFNVLGYPAGKTYNGDCGDGHRIFVNRDAKNAQVLVTNSNTGWSIVDCNATSDHQAQLATNQAAIYDVYVRILGKPGGNITVCANTLTDFTSGETLCLLGSLDLTRGQKSKFQLAPS